MTRRLDITRDVCPLTTVKIGMALGRVEPAGTLEVLLRKEALTKVVSSLKTDGHRVTAVGREGESFVLLVTKDGAGGAGDGGAG